MNDAKRRELAMTLVNTVYLKGLVDGSDIYLAIFRNMEASDDLMAEAVKAVERYIECAMLKAKEELLALIAASAEDEADAVRPN